MDPESVIDPETRKMRLELGQIDNYSLNQPLELAIGPEYRLM